jgi:hypothetical protein
LPIMANEHGYCSAILPRQSNSTALSVSDFELLAPSPQPDASLSHARNASASERVED